MLEKGNHSRNKIFRLQQRRGRNEATQSEGLVGHIRILKISRDDMIARDRGGSSEDMQTSLQCWLMQPAGSFCFNFLVSVSHKSFKDLINRFTRSRNSSSK